MEDVVAAKDDRKWWKTATWQASENGKIAINIK
jgi:hypothetical protein